jgi:hypothetical protein
VRSKCNTGAAAPLAAAKITESDNLDASMLH